MVPLGVNSHRPHAAANVLRNQYGDCKDKANLLNTLLRSLGLDAQLVLVPRFSQAHEAAPGLARAVATDGHRMAVATSSDKYAWNFSLASNFGEPGLLLPCEGVDEIQRLLKGSKEIVELGADEARGWVFLRRRLDTLAVRLTGARFPPWRQIVDECPVDRHAYVEKGALVAAIKRALVVASSLTRALHLVFTKGTLTIEAETLDYGSARTTVDAGYDDTKFGITVNGRYLLEMLKSVDTALVWLGMGAADGAMLLSGKPDAAFLGLVMPHKADEEEKPEDDEPAPAPKKAKGKKKADEPKAEPAA
jgi:DNA polymerase III sliding clamp (beta) subunit (PCNA family)